MPGEIEPGTGESLSGSGTGIDPGTGTGGGVEPGTGGSPIGMAGPSWWCCCGNPDCWYWWDLFDRADSADVGTDWNEVVGTWEIYNNYLRESGTAGAKIFCTEPIPARSAGEVNVSVEVVSPTAGQTFIIYPSCPDTDSVGDVSATFTFDGTSTWNISVSAGGSTGATEQTSALVGGKARLIVCCDFTSAAVFAYVAGGVSTDPDIGPAWADNAVFTPGRYVALSHNNGTTTTFNDFFMYELRVSATKLCLNCGCHCREIVPSKTLMATVTAATDRALCLLNEDFEMYWKWGSGTSYWQGDLVSTANDPTTTITYRLICDGSDEEVTALEIPESQTNASALGGYDAWNNMSYVEVDDDFNYATADVKTGEPSRYLYLYNFGFAIPLDVTVTGIEVLIQRKASADGAVKDLGVYLHNGGSRVRGTNQAKADLWGLTETSKTYGGQYNTWGWMLDRDLVNSSSFGLIIAAQGVTGTLRAAEIDHVQMRVYYRRREGYNWKISITNGSCCNPNPGGCTAVFRANAGSHCNPLSLNFGPFYLSWSDMTCFACYDPMSPTGTGMMSGFFYLTVTDVS